MSVVITVRVAFALRNKVVVDHDVVVLVVVAEGLAVEVTTSVVVTKTVDVPITIVDVGACRFRKSAFSSSSPQSEGARVIGGAIILCTRWARGDADDDASCVVRAGCVGTPATALLAR